MSEDDYYETMTARYTERLEECPRCGGGIVDSFGEWTGKDDAVLTMACTQCDWVGFLSVEVVA